MCPTAALRDRIFAATHRLADLEPFELRMVEVERLVLASVPVGKTECFRLGPGLEGGGSPTHLLTEFPPVVLMQR